MSPHTPKVPIFVSSTYTDMIPFRDAVRGLLNQYDADVRGMEVFGARTQKPLETCLEEVKSSEIFIGIIGMRYGSIDKKTGKSFVELEYDEAIKNHLEIKIYIIDEKKSTILPIFVECKNVTKLNKFKKILKIAHTCVNFESEIDLREKVRGDLEKFFIKRIGEPIQSRAFVASTLSSATIAKGDDFFITGTATETQFLGVAIWILGQNYFNYIIVDVASDDSYKLHIPSNVTAQMFTGQYYVVIQHPMANNRFDVVPVISGNSLVVKNSFNREKFVVQGPDQITGSQAEKNLIEFINKSAIDDTYTKLQFHIEDPVIQIDPISPKRIKDKFTISGQTNLSPNNELFVQIFPASNQKISKLDFGITGTVRVTRGDAGWNKFSFNVDLATANRGTYRVHVISQKIGLAATISFQIE